MRKKITDTELLDLKRNYSVVKSNDIIRKTRYDLSLQQNKIILYLISQIKPKDKKLKPFVLDLAEFCRICGIQDDQYNNYDYITDSVRHLMEKVNVIETDKKVIFYRWIEMAIIDKENHTIKVTIDKFLEPYLLQLTESFTSYQFENILVMQSKQSLRLYELCCSYYSVGEFTMTVEDLKKFFSVEEEYERYSNFRDKVIDKAIAEINTKTNLNISYEVAEKEGKYVKSLKFNIDRKNALEASYTAEKRYEQLNKYSQEE